VGREDAPIGEVLRSTALCLVGQPGSPDCGLLVNLIDPASLAAVGACGGAGSAGDGV